jgi:hypothetical protein
MPFSLTSYLLGVGTVVGALAFSFGGGVLVTKTAVKETAAGPTRVERVARSEPAPAAPARQPDASDNSPPPAEPAGAARPDPASLAQASVPMGRPQSAAIENAKQPEPKQPEPTKRAESAGQPEQKEATQKRTPQRKVERPKHYAERKPGSLAASRTKPPPTEDLDRPQRTGAEPTEFVFGREEPRLFGWEGRHEQPHFNLFQMLSPPPFDRDD